MRKKLIALMMGFVVLLAGCGNATDTMNEKSNESTEASDMSDKEGSAENTKTTEENGILTNLDAISEADETGLDLKEYKYSFEDRKLADEGDSVFYLADFEDDAQSFKLKDSVSIYAFNGKYIGYTKEGIEISTIGRYNDWYYLMLDRDYRFVKVTEVEAVAVDESEINNEEAVPVETTTPIQNETNVSSIDNTTPNAEASVEVETSTGNKYTPDEAIAVYRGIMEAGGITWDPSLKDVTSWGTGFMYLDKEYVEWAASTDLESCAMGDSVGNPFTKYYLEVTGSDENTVYFTAWHN